MVIVGGTGGVVFGEVLGGVAGAPLLVHHLYMQGFLSGYVRFCFGGADAFEGGWIVLTSHGRGVAVVSRFGFVDNFEHADASVGGVAVDDVGHPFEKFVGALVLVGDIEAR